MSSPSSRIRERFGETAVGIESPADEVNEKVPTVQEFFDILSMKSPRNGHSLAWPFTSVEQEDGRSSLPERSRARYVLTKLFPEPWRWQAKKLHLVRDTRGPYGLVYLKQSVAVSLLCLTYSGKLRKCEDEYGENV